MRRILVGLAYFAIAATASAQEARPSIFPFTRFERPEFEPEERREPLETDRDSFTPATKTVERGRAILESSYSFLNNRNDFDTHSYPELLLRYGITKRVELRFGWNYEQGGGSNSVSNGAGLEGIEGGGIEREARILYGFKAMVSEQSGWIPQSAFMIQGQTPTYGKETDTQIILDYVAGWKLPNRWKVDTSLRLGSATAEDDHFLIWAPSTVLRIPIGERLAVHGEWFGLFAQQAQANFSKQYFSPGVHYLITENLEVGVRVGWGLNDQSSRFFANVGFGVRF